MLFEYGFGKEQGSYSDWYVFNDSFGEDGRFDINKFLSNAEQVKDNTSMLGDLYKIFTAFNSGDFDMDKLYSEYENILTLKKNLEAAMDSGDEKALDEAFTKYETALNNIDPFSPLYNAF